MALQTRNDFGDWLPSRLLRFGLTAFSVFVWSCIDYPFSLIWFLGMLLVSMPKSNVPTGDEPEGVAEHPPPSGDHTFDEWLSRMTTPQIPPVETPRRRYEESRK